MAFNPLKNRKFVEPVMEEDVSSSVQDNIPETLNNDDILEYDRIPAYEEMEMNHPPIDLENVSYEGEKIADLQVSGLETEKVLVQETAPTAPATQEKKKFNLPLLEALSLSFILEELGAEKKKENLYKLYENEISLKENKWYNTTLKTGQVNAISLVKHLFALKDKVNEKENQKSLFSTACRFLNEIQNKQVNIVEKAVEQITTPVANSINDSSEKKTFNNRTPAQNAQYWKELTEQLNNITLNLVMEHIGANPNEDGHRGKWKVWSTGDNIAITGQKWHSWKAQKGGIGAISLLAFHLSTVNNIDTRIEEQRKLTRSMAIKELIKTFGDGDLSMIADAGTDIVFKQPFAMPHVIDFKINHVRQYLNEKRGIPMWIIDKQIKTGHLFAGCPSDKDTPKDLKNPEKLSNDDVWATFLSVNGSAAEMRAIQRTDHKAKILAVGSDKSLGGFLLKAEKNITEKTVSALEAAIDSMSYHSIYPGRVAMSCMGVNFNLAVTAAIDALDHGWAFQLAFDNDQAGNEAAIRFREQLITEIGQEEYAKYSQECKINYFDLGLRCLEESIAQDKIFYLDVQDNFVGIDVVKLFQDQAMKKWSKEMVKEMVARGSIKYLNVCPSFELMVDAEKEANNVFTKLSSGKPYYLRLKADDDEKAEITVKREAFLNAFEKISGPKYAEWEKDGSIIYSKIAIAKDWNEYFVYMKENNPKFKDNLNEQEKTYAHYSEKEDISNVKKKGKKM